MRLNVMREFSQNRPNAIGSADFQSAVPQTFSLRFSLRGPATDRGEECAPHLPTGKSALQQTESLRYE
jgi:hypothetical protein